MKAKTIFFAMAVLAVSQLAYANIPQPTPVCASCGRTITTPADHAPDCPYYQKPSASGSGSADTSPGSSSVNRDDNKAREAELEELAERERQQAAFDTGKRELGMALKGGTATGVPGLKTGTTALPLKGLGASPVPTTFPPPAEATKGKTREELSADLVSLRGEIEATQNQLLKLNKAIRSDTAQYNEWEKATNDEMLGAVKTGFDLLFDFADDRVKEHYEELVKVAREQHKSAADFRLALRQLQGIRHTKDFIDGIVLAGGEHGTWAKKLEEVRDALGLISGELGEKPASKLLGQSFAEYARFAAPYWKYGSAIANATYANTLYYFDWQAVKQLDRNNESFKLAVEKLGHRMSTLVTELKDTEAQLKERNQP